MSNGVRSTSLGRKRALGSNGCGAMSGWLAWIKPPHHKFFRSACVLHDELYLLGGSEEDRKKADIRLYRDMVKHSLDHYDGRGKVRSQAWFLTLCYLYYIAVRLFGRGQFNYTIQTK